MRTRDEITKELDSLAIRMDIGAANLYLVEILLDIRELLQEQKADYKKLIKDNA